MKISSVFSSARDLLPQALGNHRREKPLMDKKVIKTNVDDREPRKYLRLCWKGLYQTVKSDVKFALEYFQEKNLFKHT